MDLQRLQRFSVLAEEKNYSRAAERLKIPQPHLSKQIQQLERELGVKLFHRTRPLNLTAAGIAFWEEVKQILMRVEQAKRSAQRANRGEIGRLGVGINTSISNSLLPQILQVYREQFPNVQLVLQELLFNESRQKLESGEIDVDFENLVNLQDIDDQHPLTYEVILQESLVLALPETHALAKQERIHLRDLAEEGFVLPSVGRVPALYHLTFQACEQVGFQPKVNQEATWMPTVLGLVAGGSGVALLPTNAVNLQRSGVVYRAIAGPAPLFQMAMVWQRSNTSPTLHHFLTVVRQVARS